MTHQTGRACVSQSFMPFLWDAGALGGREVYVLMTRLPRAILHDRLDAAAAFHPERITLTEYRADTWIVAAENGSAHIGKTNRYAARRNRRAVR